MAGVMPRALRRPPGMPKTGAVYQVSIPGGRSGFAARPGYIYLPPAYLATPRSQRPVLVLLGGQPGDPRAWVDSGRIQAVMDGSAKRHSGLAPVVVMPDDLGSEFANPLCLNSRLGDVLTYLTIDVPDWIISHLQVRPPGQGWAIGGFSEGGTCAIQLSTQAPRLYPFFVDISGQLEPTLGSRQLTISRAFGGAPPHSPGWTRSSCWRASGFRETPGFSWAERMTRCIPGSCTSRPGMPGRT